MSNFSGAGGVCLACKHEPGCIDAAEAGRTILECAQFEMGYLIDDDPPAPAREMSMGDALGLCSNCEHRDTCIYPKPDGGVWRCEEYE